MGAKNRREFELRMIEDRKWRGARFGPIPTLATGRFAQYLAIAYSSGGSLTHLLAFERYLAGLECGRHRLVFARTDNKRMGTSRSIATALKNTARPPRVPCGLSKGL